MEGGKEQRALVLLFGSRSGKEKMLRLLISPSWEMLSWQRFESQFVARSCRVGGKAWGQRQRGALVG